MVVGSRMLEERNGRRSRGPSPHNHNTDDSSDSDDSDSDGGMHVGDDYQATIPPYDPDVKPEPRAEAMLVWAPHPDLSEEKIDEYITVAKERHGYNMEQSLGMLFWHKHHVEKSLTDLANFTPFPDEWTVEDKVLFEQAFSFHGKSFHRIRQMLPDKSIAQLVKYYYSWKKTRSRTSLMDRHARKIFAKGESDEESGNESEMEVKDGVKEETKPGSSRPGPASKKLELHPRNKKHKRKPPRGMYLNQEDLLSLATGPPGQGEALLKQLDMELVQLKRHVQNNKQLVSMHKQKVHGGIDGYKLPDTIQRINPKWTNEELLIAVQGIRKYGKDFKAIADVLGNKTEAHVRSFFVNYRKKYNLDEALLRYEKDHGIPSEKKRKTENSEENGVDSGEKLEKMEVEDNGADENQGSLRDTTADSTQDGTLVNKQPTSPLKQSNGKSGQGLKSSPSPVPMEVNKTAQVASGN